jgi:protein-S-isoprenylcysteine O-methyltransferase Ste14
MPDIIYKVVLPFFTVAAVAFLGVHRARMSRQLGRDPVVMRPFRDTDTPTRYLETILTGGFVALLFDVALNAAAPRFVETQLAVPILRHSPAVGWIGLALVTAGFVVSCAAIFGMRSSWRVGIDAEHPGALVTRGLFRFIRHPIYAGMLLIALGAAAALADVVAIALATAAFVGVPLQARMEEAFLASQYGDEYRHYLATTGRFLPRRRA